MMPHRTRTAGLVWAIPLMLAGCSWLASEEPARPVSPLQTIENPVQGGMLWSRDTGKGSAGARLQPALAGGRLFVADGSGSVVALDAGTGNAVWSADLGADVTGGVGVGSGLILAGTAEGQLVALDEATGAERWSTRLSSEVLSVPAAAQGVVAVRTNDGKVVGLDAASGGTLWTYEREVPVLSLRGAASPLIVGGQVVCGLDGGRLVNLDLASGQALWDVPVSYPTGRTDLERVVDIDAAPLVAGNGVFVATFQGSMAVIELNTGKRGWSRLFSTYNSFAADSSSLYATDDNGYVWAIDPATGETRWSQKALSGRRLAAPAVVGRWVAVGDLEGYVHWLDSASGALAGRNEVASSPIVAQLVAADGVMYALGRDGELAALRAP